MYCYRFNKFHTIGGKNMKAQFSLHNEFDIIAKNINTGEKQIAKAYNVITDQGLTWARSRSTFSTYMHLGTGQGVPSGADKSLFTFTEAKSTTKDSEGWDAATSTYFVRLKCTFNETEQNGKSFTEVGLANGSSANSLSTHAMIVDEHGSPMVVEKTDTVVLTIYATVYLKLTTPLATHIDHTLLCRRLFAQVTRNTSAYQPLIGLRNEGPLGASVPYNSTSGIYAIAAYTKAPSFETHDTGFKYKVDILGSNANDVLINTIGLVDYYYPSTTYDYYGKAILIQDIKTLTGQSTVLKDVAVGTGDGIKTFFTVSTPHPILANEKFKVKVDGVEKVATPATFKGLDAKAFAATNMGNPTIHYIGGKYYHSVKTIDPGVESTLKLYISDSIEYTEEDFVAETPKHQWSSTQTNNHWNIVPTWLPNKYIVYTSGVGVYLATLSPEAKILTPDTTIVDYPASASSYPLQHSDDLKFFVLSSNVYYISSSGEAVQLQPADRIIGNIALKAATRTIYKLEEQLGSGVMTEIGTYSRPLTKELNIFKRLPQNNMYAIICLATVTGDHFNPTGTVTIINSDTSAVTSEEYTVVNPDVYMWHANISTSLYMLTSRTACPMYDFVPDITNKTIYVYKAGSQNVGGSLSITSMYTTGESKYLGVGGDCWVTYEDSVEFISGFTLAEAPSADAKITVDGELNGFLKTSDYKITYELDVVINA